MKRAKGGKSVESVELAYVKRNSGAYDERSGGQEEK